MIAYSNLTRPVRRVAAAAGFWVGLLIVIYFLVFSSLSILKHLSLHSTYLDLGLESQVVWNTTQGRFLEASFGPSGELISALSFHVSPISLFLAPFYWLFSDPIVLLIAQTLVLSLGGLPIFWLARKVTGSSVLAFAILVSYLLYPPLEYSNLSDFHPQTLATTIILFSFWYLYNRNFRNFYFWMFLGLLVKENISLLYAALGLYLIFVMRERRRGIFVFLISIFYFLSALYFLMPYFSGGTMGALGRYQYLGTSPREIIWHLLSRPTETLGILLMPPKIKYLFHLLVSVGFLPILAPGYLLLAASEFFLNLFSVYNPQWQVKFHYTAAITPFIFIAAIFGVGKLRRSLRHTTSLYSNVVKRETGGNWWECLLSIYLVLISLLWNILHSPSPLFYKFDPNIYRVTKETEAVRRVLKRIPPEASVSAMNNLGAHLAQRRFLYRFPINYDKADYIVVDPRLPSESFDLSQIDFKEFKKIIEEVRVSQNYRQVVDLERLLVFEKIGP